MTASLSPRAYGSVTSALSWEEIWEAGPYYDRLSELLENARSYAIVAGWQIDSRLPMLRPRQSQQETLKTKLIRLCEEKPGFRVFLLMWDHSYFYVLERELWQGRVWENIHPRVHFVFDNRHPFGASHHEKIVIIDGQVALCGGVDLCAERWDSTLHLYKDPRRSLNLSNPCKEEHGPYHDLAVQVTGPVCAKLQEHLVRRWQSLSSIPFPGSAFQEDPKNPTQSGQAVYVSRTICLTGAPTPRSRPLIREIEFLFRDLIASARHRILIEGQYYWSELINDMLIAKINQMAGKDFEVLLILAKLQTVQSLSRKMSGYELALLSRLRDAANASGVRLNIGSPSAFDKPSTNATPPKPVYIHSKIVIIDDRFLSIGSANMATRALRVDTEIALTLEAKRTEERAHIRNIASKILTHWKMNENPQKTAAFSDLKMNPILPRLEFRHLDATEKIISWAKFFDPPVPWLHSLKHRYRKLSLPGSNFHSHAALLAWSLPFSISLLFTDNTQPEEGIRTTVLAGALLSSSWILPIPFALVVFVSSLAMGPEQAANLAVTVFWITSGLGYLTGRVLPATMARLHTLSSPTRLPARLGMRGFPALVSVLIDPRIAIRSKVVYQGIFCIPVPWFALGTWIILGSTVYTGTVLGYHAALAIMPAWMFDALSRHATLLLIGIAVVSLIELMEIVRASKPKEEFPKNPWTGDTA
jgi:phospholipase D1/2